MDNNAAERRFSSGTAVVTGAASGIGEGLARHLATRGMTVIVADLDDIRAETVAEDIRSRGARAIARRLDVADSDSVEALAAWVFAEFGSVELLINNAGIQAAGFLWEIDIKRWEHLMRVNVDGVFHCVRSFVPRMIEVGTPSCVVNLSSVGGVITVAVQSPYIVSKHAVQAMTECLHQDLAIIDAPIQVSAVIPHSIRSDIFLSMQREAPTDNPIANGVFEAMQRDNVATGVDPLVAAEHMMNQVARGDFWIFSDDERCTAATSRRANQLLEHRPPDHPRAMLERMGVAFTEGTR